MMSMLPIPSFKDNDLDAHSYCSIKELLQYIALFNYKSGYNKIKNTHRKILHSKHVLEFLSQIK